MSTLETIKDDTSQRLVSNKNADPNEAPPPGLLEPLSSRKNLNAALKLLPAGCTQFVNDHEHAFLSAPGSGHNHQFWLGGYADHLDEIFAIAAVFYRGLSQLREMTFTLEEALLVLFLHDVEKCFKRLPADIKSQTNEEYLELAVDQHKLQEHVIAEYGLKLNEEQQNALKYVHGELDDYRKNERVMGRLAVFVHDCDYFSARGWFDQPQADGRLANVIYIN